MAEAYIVKGYRTAIGKAPKGLFRFKRPDELAAETINYVLNTSETACPTEILIQPQRSPWKKADMHI